MIIELVCLSVGWLCYVTFVLGVRSGLKGKRGLLLTRRKHHDIQSKEGVREKGEHPIEDGAFQRGD